MATLHPEPVNFTDIGSIFTYVNVLGEGWTMVIFLIVMYVIFLAFMMRKGADFSSAFVAASYAIAIICGFMFAIGMIPFNAVIVFVSIMSLSLVVRYVARTKTK